MKAKRSVAKVSNPRKLLALLFVGLFFLSVVSVASASEWSYRKAITIDHEKVVADLADFPVLISMTDTELRDKAQPDGDDILFVNADNTIRLDHEIEHFNGSTGELQAWVRIPSLSSTTNTTIYMYYGNLTCENQQNATDVWDSNYEMVQHLHEIAKTAGYYNDHLDSTSNNNDGEAYTTPETNMDATGWINGADKFDGGDDYVAVSNNKNINFGPNQDFSLSAWIKAKPNQTRWQGTILAKMNSPEGSLKRAYGYSLMVRGVTDTTNEGKIGVWLGDGVGGAYSVFRLYSNATYDDDDWHHVVATLDRDGLAKLYIDGYEINSTDISHLSSIDESYPENLEIGREGVFDTYEFAGTID